MLPSLAGLTAGDLGAKHQSFGNKFLVEMPRQKSQRHILCLGVRHFLATFFAPPPKSAKNSTQTPPDWILFSVLLYLHVLNSELIPLPTTLGVTHFTYHSLFVWTKHKDINNRIFVSDNSKSNYYCSTCLVLPPSVSETNNKQTPW